jgi:plasmid stabilization system protein ParE
MNFRVHEDARAELVGAASSYEAARPGLGTEFTDLVLEAFQQIEIAPRQFAKLESTKLTGDIRRRLLAPRFPYIIIYEVRADLIEVLAVAHGSRIPDYWAERREED